MKILSPRNAKTEKQVCSLRRDNYDTKRFWILVDAGNKSHHVVLAAQKNGEASTAKIEIPRRDFIALIDWYQREQDVRKRKS